MTRKLKLAIAALDWISRGQTLLMIGTAIAAGTLVSAILRTLSVVSGLWFLTVGFATFVLVLAVCLLATERGWVQEMARPAAAEAPRPPAPADVAPQQPGNIQAAPRPAPTQPNLIFLRVETIKIRFSADRGAERFFQGEGDNDPLGIIACFRNEPSVQRRVVDAEYVRAQVVYRDAHGQEVGNGVPSACWLGESTDMVDFDVGQSHCALLGLLLDGNLVVPYKHREKHWDGDAIIMRDETLAGVSSIDLRIIENNRLLIPPLLLHLTVVDDKPVVERI